MVEDLGNLEQELNKEGVEGKVVQVSTKRSYAWPTRDQATTSVNKCTATV